MLDRWIHTQTTIRVPFEVAARALTGDTSGVIERAFEPASGHLDHDGVFTLRDTVAWGAHVEQVDLRAIIGEPRNDGRRVLLPFRWGPLSTAGAHADLDGELELIPTANGAVLALNASCRLPPGARPDGVILTAAQRLGRRVVREIAEQIDAAKRTGERATPHLLVRDLMTPAPVTLHTDQSLLSATLVLLQHRIAGAPVVDGTGRLVGVFSESDMLVREATPSSRAGRQAREEQRRRNARTVGEACSRPAVTVSPDVRVRAAARRLIDRYVGRLIVVDGGHVVGVLSRHDVLRALTRTAEELLHAVEGAIDPVHAPGVEVSVDLGSRVRLTGTARDQEAAGRVVAAVMSVDGVSGVDNDLIWDGRVEMRVDA